MGKWYGKIGYVKSVETSPGVYDDEVVEHEHYGDVQQINRRFQSTEHLNDDLTISIELSIVASPYAQKNYHYIKYAEFMGVKWKVINAEPRHPRLVLTLGGEYNG